MNPAYRKSGKNPGQEKTENAKEKTALEEKLKVDGCGKSRL
jgi:hypothetical protein